MDNNREIIGDLMEFTENIELNGKQIQTRDFVKVIGYRHENDVLDEVTLEYIYEVKEYLNGSEYVFVKRILSKPFPSDMKGLMNYIRKLEQKTPLKVFTE